MYSRRLRAKGQTHNMPPDGAVTEHQTDIYEGSKAVGLCVALSRRIHCTRVRTLGAAAVSGTGYNRVEAAMTPSAAYRTLPLRPDTGSCFSSALPMQTPQ